MYAMGIGVPAHNETALHYFRTGQRSKEASSINGLGYMYLHGYGEALRKLAKLKNLIDKA